MMNMMKKTLKNLCALLLICAALFGFLPRANAAQSAPKAAPTPVEPLPYTIAGYGQDADGASFIKVVVKDRYMSDARLLGIARDLVRGEPFRGKVLFYGDGDCTEDAASVAEVLGYGERFAVVGRIESWRGAPSETQFRRYGYYRALYNAEPNRAQSELIELLAERYAIDATEASALVAFVAPYTRPSAVAQPFQQNP